MKALPFGKGEVTLVRCQICERWVPPQGYNNCYGWEWRTFISAAEPVFSSSYYAGRVYYASDNVSEIDLRYCCSCGNVITNTYDNDEEDNTVHTTQQAWECGQCHIIHALKEEADACCA